MAEEGSFEVHAEAEASWRKRGAEPEVFDASPVLKQKVRDTLKSALQAQLAREVETIGGRRPETLTIHGKSGVSNSPTIREQREG
jgi:hypothetical protein